MQSDYTKWFIGFVALSIFMILSGNLFAQTIVVHSLASAPTLDGSDSDWSGLPSSTISMRKNKPDGKSDVHSVSLKAGVFGDDFYLFVQWSDATEDLIHKPFVWNAKENRYVRGPQREDRFSIQFAMDGDYTTDWFSGNEFKADMWHWKSSRTNPVGLAHDKMTIISAKPLKRSYKTKAKNGKIVYLHRPSDQGDKIYYSKRYSQKENEVMPKYFFTPNPQGSIVDVKAKGVWKNGMWYLEIERKLNTGNTDDVVFVKGKRIKAGIGIFNCSEADDHNISETLIFKF